MRITLAILLSFILGGCYTRVADNFSDPDIYYPILDSTTFLPDRDYMTSAYSISNLYGNWINSREEENNIIKIYRQKDYKEFPPGRFRSRINFYENGECKYLVSLKGDRQIYVIFRWRVLKENTNIVYLYNEIGIKNKSFHIEELRGKILKLVWLK